MRTRNLPLRAFAAAALLAAPLTACGGEGTADTAEAGDEVGNDTLAAALSDSDDLGRVSEALNETGLAQVFDGSAPYTILAPTDAAFDAFVSDIEVDERDALIAGVLRNHILPGALTREDIAKAIETQKGDVEMTTMGEGIVTFSADGDTIRVTDADGGTATLGENVVLASNGVAIPIDGVLEKP